MGIEIKKLTPELCDDWLGYFDGIAFGDHGEWALCYCLEGHMTRQANEDLKDPAERRTYARDLILKGEMQGYLAYDGEKVVGWCNANDRRKYEFLEELFTYQNYEPDSRKTKAVFCFLIAAEYRGRKLAGRFLDRVCEDAKNDGYERVEAYPFADVSMEFQFHGTAAMYAKHGFVKIADFQFIHVYAKDICKNSELLQKARVYEEEKGKLIAKEEKPAFHLAPWTGWMNDPNGFSVYQGQYHLFYQYYPYDAHWGPMHWGHAVSEDLLHWEYLPAALAPDQAYDKDGVFSGSAIELEDGRQLLVYTGVSKTVQADGQIEEVQTQCIAVGDGKDYVKSVQNPVISTDMIPEGGSKRDFRDPKIWRQEDGSYRMLVANRPADQSGQLLLYRSEDAFHWEFDKVFAENRCRLGKMWECPDFFELDGKGVVFVSPQDMKTDAYDADRAWVCQMSLPRELEIRENRLYQKPIRELENYRSHKVEYADVNIKGDNVSLSGVSGRCIDLEVQILKAEEKEIFERFTISLAADDTCHTDIHICPKDSLVLLDRQFSGTEGHINQRSVQVPTEDMITMRIIMDRFSMEVFINDGSKVMSAVLDTKQSADRIRFSCEGDAVIRVTKYDLIM